MALRPEHARIDGNGELFTVEMTEALGGVSFCHLTASTGEKLIVEEPGEAPTRTGNRAGVLAEPERLLMFDTKSTARIH